MTDDLAMELATDITSLRYFLSNTDFIVHGDIDRWLAYATDGNPDSFTKLKAGDMLANDQKNLDKAIAGLASAAQQLTAHWQGTAATSLIDYLNTLHEYLKGQSTDVGAAADVIAAAGLLLAGLRKDLLTIGEATRMALQRYQDTQWKQTIEIALGVLTVIAGLATAGVGALAEAAGNAAAGGIVGATGELGVSEGTSLVKGAISGADADAILDSFDIMVKQVVDGYVEASSMVVAKLDILVAGFSAGKPGEAIPVQPYLPTDVQSLGPDTFLSEHAPDGFYDELAALAEHTHNTTSSSGGHIAKRLDGAA